MSKCEVCGSRCRGRYCSICGPLERTDGHQVRDGADQAYLSWDGPHRCDLCGGIVQTRAALAEDCPHGPEASREREAEPEREREVVTDGGEPIDAGTLQRRLRQESSTPRGQRPKCPYCASLDLSPRGHGMDATSDEPRYRCNSCHELVDDPIGPTGGPGDRHD